MFVITGWIVVYCVKFASAIKIIKNPKRKERKRRLLARMIAVGMIHPATIFAVAMFAAVRM
jgi:amino acid transporter